MSKIIHLIDTGFNRGINQSLEWWQYRLKIFEYFTLTSLENQTNKDFYILMELQKNYPLKEELETIIKKHNMKSLVFMNDNFQNHIDLLKNIPEYTSADYVYTTRIDTDDLFHKTVIDEVQSHDFKWRKALVYQKGYCYDCKNKKLQHYVMPSPPFSTLMFPKDIFIDQKKRTEYVGELYGHDEVFRKFDSVVLSENKYVVLIHQDNLSSIYIENLTKLDRFEIPQKEHDSILSEFGINSHTFEQIT